jgi:hypothetical protein
MTLVGRVHYERLALRPSSVEDAQKLKNLGYKGYVYPVDEKLGVSRLPFDMTISTMLKVAQEACKADSYEDAQNRLAELGITVNDDTIRVVTNAVGKLVLENEMIEAERAFSVLNKGKLSFPEIKIPKILYLLVDGSMVHTRKEYKAVEKPHSSNPEATEDVTAPEKSSPDTPLKRDPWREDKLGMAFSTDNVFFWTDTHGEQQHHILKKDYVSYIGALSDFHKLMFSMALRNGYGTYDKTILLSDGATWIRDMKNIFFYDAQQILDYWHLCENVSNYAKAVFALDEKAYKPWTDDVCALLKKSKTLEALAKIKSLSKKQSSRATSNLAQYIENNIDNIDYATYLKKDYFIGSGAIESSNRYVVQRRVKLPGMRWNLDSVQNVVTLMTKIKSNRWEQDVVDAVYQHYGLAPGRKFSEV